MDESGTSLRQRVQRDVGHGRARAHVQILQFVTVQGKALAGAVGDLLAVLEVQQLGVERWWRE